MGKAKRGYSQVKNIPEALVSLSDFNGKQTLMIIDILWYIKKDFQN